MRTLVDPERSVTSLKLVNDEGRIVVRDGPVAHRSETGQLIFDFERSYQPGKVEDGFGPARVRERFEEARRVADEDPLSALTIYSELVGREPGNFEAHMRLATLLEREGDLAGALRHLLGAATIVPASADVHLKLGLLYRKKDESAERAAKFSAHARMRSRQRRGTSQRRRDVRSDGPQTRLAAPPERHPPPDQGRLALCLLALLGARMKVRVLLQRALSARFKIPLSNSFIARLVLNHRNWRR